MSIGALKINTGQYLQTGSSARSDNVTVTGCCGFIGQLTRILFSLLTESNK